MREHNLYELLQVIPTADAEIIQAAYRRLMLRHHPDRSNELNAAEMTQRLNDAYAILSDPARRAEYDRELRGRTSSSSSGTGQTSSRTSQSRPPSGTGRTSSRTSQSRPNPAPPPHRTPPPRRASTPPRAVHVECPHCKKIVIPTNGEPSNLVKKFLLNPFFLMCFPGRFRRLIWGDKERETLGMCSNCGKNLPANLIKQWTTIL